MYLHVLLYMSQCLSALEVIVLGFVGGDSF